MRKNASSTRRISSTHHFVSNTSIELISQSTQTLDCDFPSDNTNYPRYGAWFLFMETTSIHYSGLRGNLHQPYTVSSKTQPTTMTLPLRHWGRAIFCGFVVSGETKWIDKSKENLIKCAVEAYLLTMVEPPLENLKQPKITVNKEHLNWFEKYVVFGNQLGWKVTAFKNKYGECESKCCMYSLNKEKLNRVIQNIRLLDDDEPAEKKYHVVYTQGIFEAFENGFQEEKTLWFLFRDKGEISFPQRFFTGFMGIVENNSDSNSTSDSSSI